MTANEIITGLFLCFYAVIILAAIGCLCARLVRWIAEEIADRQHEQKTQLHLKMDPFVERKVVDSLVPEQPAKR